jgi:hypothetical protein
VKTVAEDQSADPARILPEPRGARDPAQLRGLASKIGNRAMGALLQRETVNPMPIIHRQFLMWRSRSKVLDLNCGWFSQLAVVDHLYMKNIRQKLTPAQQQQLEGASSPHLSYSAGRTLIPYSNTTVFTDYGYNPRTDGIATKVDLPNGNTVAMLTNQWKDLLRRHGPLIVSGPFGEPFGVPHYVTVVSVRNNTMYYLDALAFKLSGSQGTLRSQPFATMAANVGSIDRVSPLTVDGLFAGHVAQAAAPAPAQ